MNVKHVLIAAGLVVIAGCTTTDHLYSQGRCLTCMNNPLTGEPLNYDPAKNPMIQGEAGSVATGSAAQGQMTPAGDTRGSFSLQSPLDVDLAYARLRGEFGFRSDADFNSNLRDDRLAMMDSAWHFNATPGTFYELSDYSEQALDGVQHHIVLKANIQRSGVGSTINMAFAPADSAYSGAAMAAALKQRAESVLN